MVTATLEEFDLTPPAKVRAQRLTPSEQHYLDADEELPELTFPADTLCVVLSGQVICNGVLLGTGLPADAFSISEGEEYVVKALEDGTVIAWFEPPLEEEVLG